MAKVVTQDEACFGLQLSLEERQTVKLHADREGLSFEEAMEDLIEYSIVTLSRGIVQEEDDSRRSHTEDSLTILLHIMYPKEGPLSVFDGTEKGLIATMLLDTLDLGVHTVRHTHKQTEIINGLERQDEGMGSGKPTIPIDGRSNNNVRGSVGPGIVERQVQGEGAGQDRLPDSD